MTELIEIGVGIAGSFIGAAVTWGVLKTKVDRLEKDREADREDFEKRIEKVEINYVANKHFESVIKPVDESLREVRADVKTLIASVAIWRNELDIRLPRR